MKHKPVLPPTCLWAAMIVIVALHFVFPVARLAVVAFGVAIFALARNRRGVKEPSHTPDH